MMKKFLLISVVSAIIFCSAAVSFSSEKAENQSEVKAENAEVKADAKPENAAKESAALLAGVLEKYRPEDFLSYRIPGKPVPVKGEYDSFNINVRISFNEKFYNDSFLPDLINVLDKIALPAQNNDYALAVYDKFENSEARFYKFKDDESLDIMRQFEKFNDRMNNIQGISLEYFNRETQSLEKIDRKFDMIFLIYMGKGIIKPAIIFDGKENSNVRIPCTVKMPGEAIPSDDEIALYFIHADKSRRPGNGWMGMKIVSRGNLVYISEFVKNSPAYEAGLQEYDSILSVNGHELKSEDDLLNLVANSKAGDVIVMEVQRQDKRMTFSVTLGVRPE